MVQGTLTELVALSGKPGRLVSTVHVWLSIA